MGVHSIKGLMLHSFQIVCILGDKEAVCVTSVSSIIKMGIVGNLQIEWGYTVLKVNSFQVVCILGNKEVCP
jgi:hypothetical protein